jgi:hypothetical protein
MTRKRNSFRVFTALAASGLIFAIAACVHKASRNDVKGDQRTPSGFFDTYGAAEEAPLTDSEKLGRLIWYNATAGNSRYHTYTLMQHLVGSNIDFGKYFTAANREHRFDKFGLINDPDCCTPGSAGCAAKTMDETFGFDFCPGDEQIKEYYQKLAAYQADPARNQKPKFRDPACDLKDPNGGANKQSMCDLEFGISTGALGFRKFPNPKFVAAKWKGWDNYAKNARDQSIEPPYLIGETCGSCHIAFNPLKPPADPNHPAWENIKGTVGNQYIQHNAMISSGLTRNSIEWQLFKYDRPGTADTSSSVNDSNFNPGTMNAIINLPHRPKFTESVKAWRQVASCNVTTNWQGAPTGCMQDKNGKFWELSTQDQSVMHILKGGEDSIGPAGAVQRVYINIGSCAEACWMNHHSDVRVVDPTQRGYDQTPFDIGQCRRDCPQFRAVEDRVGDIFAFLSSAKQTDLHEALATTPEGLEDWLAKRGYPKGAVDQGRAVFKQNCAQCHSSQDPSTLSEVTFNEVDERGMKMNWLGSDEIKPFTDVKTFACRALHTNHKKGHVYEQYASNDYYRRSDDPTNAPALRGIAAGGPGYYRALSLINAWAYAPFMHNNAIGPEICARAKERDPALTVMPGECTPFPVSVEERFSVYERSMDEMLHPDKRVLKTTVTDDDVLLPLMPGYKLKIAKGTPAAKLGSFRHKEFLRDFLVFLRSNGHMETFKQKMSVKHKEPQQLAALMQGMAATAKAYQQIGKEKGIVEADPRLLKLYFDIYSNCSVAGPENTGHEFGKDLTEDEKKALTAFLATQ